MPNNPMSAAFFLGERTAKRSTFGRLTAPGPVWSLVPRFAVPPAPPIAPAPASAAPSLPETTAPFATPPTTRRTRVLLGGG